MAYRLSQNFLARTAHSLVAGLLFIGCAPSKIEVKVGEDTDGAVPSIEGSSANSTGDADSTDPDTASVEPDDSAAADGSDSAMPIASGENPDTIGGPGDSEGGEDGDPPSVMDETAVGFAEDALPDFDTAAAPAASVDNAAVEGQADVSTNGESGPTASAPEPPSTDAGGSEGAPESIDLSSLPDTTTAPAQRLGAPFVGLPPSLISLLTRTE